MPRKEMTWSAVPVSLFLSPALVLFFSASRCLCVSPSFFLSLFLSRVICVFLSVCVALSLLIASPLVGFRFLII